MDLRRSTSPAISSPPPFLRPQAASFQNDEQMNRSVEAICEHGDRIQLRPQQRVLPPAEKIILLREGMLAVDAMPTKGRLQILDFLIPGDVVSASAALPTTRVSLRAITSASLVALNAPAFDAPAPHYWKVLFTQCQNQLTRASIYQLMIGRLETESRVASFLLALALRNATGHAAELTIPLPMSRTDVANYLVINSDTLSRTMVRLGTLRLIERVSRHAVRVIDIDGLMGRSPLAPLLSAIFDRDGSRLRCARALKEESELSPSATRLLPPVASQHQTTRHHASVRQPCHASR